MARSYRAVDRDQVFLLPPDMRQWLPEEHVVWFLIDAVRQMDTSAFHAQARRGGAGREGYDPDMLLTLFVYAMAQGISSSRKIEALCRTDVAFRVICAQDVPDHTVLARFRQRHEDALVGLLEESLVLAARLGMLKLGVVALDGTRIAANAASAQTRSEDTLCAYAQQYVRSVQDSDECEDALFGAQRSGDELPADVRDRTHRGARIAAALAQIEQLKAARTAQEREREDLARQYEQALLEGQAPTGLPPGRADAVMVAWARWRREWSRCNDRLLAYQEKAARGQRPRGLAPQRPELGYKVQRTHRRYLQALVARGQKRAGVGGADPVKKSAPPSMRQGQPRANMTDPDSRLLKTATGWVQGMNCQLSVSEDGLVLSARATQEHSDGAQFLPTLEATQQMLAQVQERVGGDVDLSNIGIVLADAGYDSKTNLQAPGPDRLIPDARRHTIEARAQQDPDRDAETQDEAVSARERMNRRLRTAEGIRLYRKRASMIEPVNAWLKDRRGLRRFSRRGLSATNSELNLATAVTNLLKIFTQPAPAATA